MLQVRNLRNLCLIMLVMLTSSQAHATNATGLMAVSATVLSVCAVVATPMLFPDYSATSGTPTDATSVITAVCTGGVGYTISLNAGAGTGATVATRVLTSGANTLNYTIYKNSNHTTIWGDGTLSTATTTGTAGLIPDIFTAYGRIPTAQQAAAGIYLDTITVTLAY